LADFRFGAKTMIIEAIAVQINIIIRNIDCLPFVLGEFSRVIELLGSLSEVEPGDYAL